MVHLPSAKRTSETGDKAHSHHLRSKESEFAEEVPRSAKFTQVVYIAQVFRFVVSRQHPTAEMSVLQRQVEKGLHGTQGLTPQSQPQNCEEPGSSLSIKGFGTSVGAGASVAMWT
jgi:hypothetical protein